MLIYSILFPILAIIAIIVFFFRFRSGKLSLSSFFIWSIIWKLDKLEDDVNKIVKEVAISNEISLDDEEEK